MPQLLVCWISLSTYPIKTKTMVLSTSQMSIVHPLGQFNPSFRIFNRSLERVNISKLLGIHFSGHLYLVYQLSKSCYMLGILRKIKDFSNFKLRKHPTESLVLSKTYRCDYCVIFFHSLPDFLLKRFSVASYVAGRYARDIDDVLKIRLLLATSEGKWRFSFA